MAHGKHKPKQEEEGGEGAPLWIISFADMMSLLMAFFVMLSTFSGFGPNEAEKLQRAVKATLAPNYYGGWRSQDMRTAVGAQAPAAGQAGKGSEKPTLQETQGSGLLKETQAGEFRKRKVFLIESNTVFWGAGTVLSPGGRDFLDTLASFAAQVPGRIVISENGPTDLGTEGEGQSPDDEEPKREDGGRGTEDSDILQAPPADLGLRRAATALNYLTTRGISKDRCSLGVRGMSPDQEFEKERMLEIVLLDTSVYQ
jgi:outer membrane protein OmpA-like peptidoglycan-associated protein